MYFMTDFHVKQCVVGGSGGDLFTNFGYTLSLNVHKINIFCEIHY